MRGSSRQNRALPSVASASALLVPFTRRTAASAPGPATVLRNSWWSYCRDTHVLSAIVGVASSASSSSPRSAPAPNLARSSGAGSSAWSSSCDVGPRDGAVVERSVAETADRHVGDRLAIGADARTGSSPGGGGGFSPGTPIASNEPSNTRKRSGVGDAPDDRRADSPNVRASSRTASSCAGATIASIRSWLSDVSTSTGFMPGSRLATRATSTSMPTPPLAAVSDAAHDRPAAPRSCTPTASLRSSSSRHASISRFSSNGSPTCTDGRLVSLALVEAGRREHARAADAVAARRRAEQHRQVAGALGPGEHEPFGRKDAEAEHVHERVVAVRVVEHDLAADGRHADRVAVAADAGHDALEEIARARVVERAEAQRIHQRDRTRAHREDVADDAADAGRRTLVRLDRRRMVVTLDAHRDRETVADVDDTRALTRTDEHPRRLGRESDRGARATTCTSSARTT